MHKSEVVINIGNDKRLLYKVSRIEFVAIWSSRNRYKSKKIACHRYRMIRYQVGQKDMNEKYLSVFDFKQREKEVAVLDEKIVDYWR